MRVLVALIAAVCLAELALCQETCTVDVDCAGHVCHHGSPHCEIHDPNSEHGHCNCHSAKRAEEPCTVDAECSNHTCHHGSPNCEIHDPNMQHGHCNCHSAKRYLADTCHNGHQCDCGNGDTGVCNSQGHCDCGNNGKRAAESCDAASHKPQCGNTQCPSGNNAICNQEGHCECGDHAVVGKRNATARALRATPCTSNDQCTNTCPHGMEAFCNMATADQGHWACDCRHLG